MTAAPFPLHFTPSTPFHPRNICTDHSPTAQIVADLDPGSPLAISQVSKAVHATLLSKQARPVWQLVLKSAKWPVLEAEMSEPFYAALLRGGSCMSCGGTPKKTEVDYSVRIRTCSKCLKANLRIEAWVRK